MSLAAERDILKKIHKLNIARRQLCEKKQHDQQIKQQKAAVSTLRGSLKEKRTDISELKVELSTVQTAVSLGCEVKDLLGKKIECPTGEYWNGFRCSKMPITGKCEEDKFYNFKHGRCDDKCNAKSGQIWCKITKRCIYRCQKINQLWNDEKKECQETTINTTLCTPGNFFDSSKKTCRKFCSVNRGMYFNPQKNLFEYNRIESSPQW